MYIYIDRRLHLVSGPHLIPKPNLVPGRALFPSTTSFPGRAQAHALPHVLGPLKPLPCVLGPPRPTAGPHPDKTHKHSRAHMNIYIYYIHILIL